jgi:hypothetical protein
MKSLGVHGHLVVGTFVLFLGFMAIAYGTLNVGPGNLVSRWMVTVPVICMWETSLRRQLQICKRYQILVLCTTYVMDSV